jgi:indoleamine 2,3-dioxygenase
LIATIWAPADEEWFRLIHVQIEAQAAPAIAALPLGQAAAAAGDTAGVRQALEALTSALLAMQVCGCVSGGD